MTVTAPPRPPHPRPSDPVTHGELDALVEALIEEARKRARRRRLRNGAFVALVALAGVALLAVLGRGAESQTAASPAPSARSNAAAQAVTSRIAFISGPPPGGGGYCGVVYVMNADGSGQRRLTNGGVPGCGQENRPAWSPDGRRIAFVLFRYAPATRPEIWVMNADGTGGRTLARNVAWSVPAWSPDGREIAFTRNGGVYLMNADGTRERRLVNGGSPAWSPDGQKVAFARSSGIYVLNANGTGQRLLTDVGARELAWSPRGNRIAFVSDWQVYVVNADGSGQRTLTHTNVARNVTPAWSPNGRRIVFVRRVGRRAYRGTPLEYGQCSRCDERVSSQVYAMHADGSEPRKLARDAAQPVWSPDGRKIAFKRESLLVPHGGMYESDIYVMNPDGSGKRNLTRNTRRNAGSPVWSPALK